jgi:glycosyltransferase involved in cell wall biosynthesis
MRVAYFADSLPPKTDGVARTIAQLVNTLHEEQLEYHLFSPFKPDDQYFWKKNVDQVFSVPLFLYSDYRIGLPSSHRVYDQLDSFKPNIIHVTSPTYLGQLGLKYGQRRGIPVVSSYHTHFVSYFKYYGFQRFESLGWQILKKFYNQFDCVYVPSPSTAQELEERGFENIELWQRGIDLSSFSPNKLNPKLKQKLSPTQDPILLFVGRLVQEKDLYDLIKVDRILKMQKKKYEIVIVGDGPMRLQLEKELPDAHFTGWLHGEQLSEIYASSDIFVFPSTTETFGNVILEAYASGLPMVCVNEGGVVDLIMDGYTGFITEAKNPKDIAEKVNILLSNPDLRKKYADNAQKYAATFSWSKINRKLISSYRQLIFEYANKNRN